MTKAKIITFDSRSELKAWFDLRGDEDRAIIFSHRENLPNNMVKYESIVVTRQGTQRIPEKATVVVQRFLERYTGTLGITTRLADGVKTVSTTDGTGTVVPRKEPSFATKIINYLKELGRAAASSSINKAIGYNGPGIGSIYTNLTKTGKIIRLTRGYYIHPDFQSEATKFYPPTPKAVEPPELISTPIVPVHQPAANGAALAHRLVIHDTPVVAPKPSFTPPPKVEGVESVVEWLGSMAVRRQDPRLFKYAMEIKAIFAEENKAEVTLTVIPSEAKLVRAPEIALTERQQNFGTYLKDKIDRDVSPQELVENVLGKEYNSGNKFRFIYDSDMVPHGWYRTRENNSNMWRHESRRRRGHRIPA